MKSESYWKVVWGQYKKSKIGMLALWVLTCLFIIGLYAPLFASSKPLVVIWDGSIYFPLFRYLFYQGFYTKPIDLFFNLLMFTCPLIVLWFVLFKHKIRKICVACTVAAHCILFGWLLLGGIKDPAHNHLLATSFQKAKEEKFGYNEDPLLAALPSFPDWNFELGYLSTYDKLNLILEHQRLSKHHERLTSYRNLYSQKLKREMPTLWNMRMRNEETLVQRLQTVMRETQEAYLQARDQFPGLINAYRPFSHAFIMAKYAVDHARSDQERQSAQMRLEQVKEEAAVHRFALLKARQAILSYQKAQSELNALFEKKQWIEKQAASLYLIISPFFRPFHWEEDAGGSAEANQHLPWWELSRTNRKDLAAGLFFGIRISIVVGVTAILLALCVGIPLGTFAGYFAGKTDLFICRLIEMWEAMPTFFMLLLIVAILQTKSIFLVITVLGLFGWTSFARFIRSEMLKQRSLPYVEACHCLGYSHTRIMFSHLLPNAIPPVLTLLPFSMMAAITSEAGLSFLGLGEEGSTSWGVLMDEGRSVFPAESYLLWPPAILLTILLICIALAGDVLRDALDPKMRTE